MRKFLIFFDVIIVISALILAGFWFSKRGDTNQSALIDNSLVSRFDKQTEKYELPKEIFQITKEWSSFANISADGKELWYYNPENGEIRSTPTNGMPNGSSLVSKIQPGALNISWANNKTLIARYGTGSIFYNLINGSSKKYGPEIRNPEIFKSGDKIAYTYYNSGNLSGEIIISDPNIEGSKKIMSTRFGDWKIKWLSEEKLALINSGYAEGGPVSVFALDIASGDLVNIIDSKNNLDLIWSPNGQKLAYSYKKAGVAASEKESLFFMDSSLKQEGSLKLNIPASKCTWSSDNKNIICAYLNDFVVIDTTSTDVVPKILTTISELFSGGSSNASDLILNQMEDLLVFKNLQNNKLYGLYLTGN